MQTVEPHDREVTPARIDGDVGLLIATAGVRDRGNDKVQRRAIKTGDIIEANRRAAAQAGHDPKDSLLSSAQRTEVLLGDRVGVQHVPVAAALLVYFSNPRSARSANRPPAARITNSTAASSA